MAVTYETLCELKITDTEGCKFDTMSDKFGENIVRFPHAIRTRKYNKIQTILATILCYLNMLTLKVTSDRNKILHSVYKSRQRNIIATSNMLDMS
jgi:hypothetical protein